MPAGGTMKILVGFQNNGENNFIVDNVDASLRYNNSVIHFIYAPFSLVISHLFHRYPQDFSYFIQNVRNKYNSVPHKLISNV